MIQRVYRRPAAVVLSARAALYRWLAKLPVAVLLAGLLVGGWGYSVVRPYWRLTLNGPRQGLMLTGDEVSVAVLIRWGWPSTQWMDREHLRSGRSWHGDDWHFGFSVIRTGAAWYGQNAVVVRAFGIGLPWWYLLLLAAAGPLAPILRRRQLRHRRARRRRGLCANCGYDLRASGGRCPECGKPVNPLVRRDLDRRFGPRRPT